MCTAHAPTNPTTLTPVVLEAPKVDEHTWLWDVSPISAALNAIRISANTHYKMTHVPSTVSAQHSGVTRWDLLTFITGQIVCSAYLNLKYNRRVIAR